MKRAVFKRAGFCVLLTTFGGFAVSCAPNAPAAHVHKGTDSEAVVSPPALSATEPVDMPGIHNVVAYADDLYSGSVPEGAVGFESLRAMGIRTIISVDGAQPDVEAAGAKGMRYVHLPIGYDGISEQRTLELARAVRDLPGPIFVHCHHGKHRSAGAAGAVAVTLNLASREAMLGRMKVSGTAPNYVGLFACVQNAAPASEAELLLASNEFPSHYKTSGLVQSMVEIDETFEHLKAIENAGWATPPDHPDLVPAAEAGRLADLLRALMDDPDVKSHPQELVDWLDRDYKDSTRLEESLLMFKPLLAADKENEDGQRQRKALSAQFKVIAASCKECHAKYRD